VKRLRNNLHYKFLSKKHSLGLSKNAQKVGDISFFKMLYMVLYFFFLGYQENKYFNKSMEICQFLYHAMPLNNGHLAFGLGGPLFQKHLNPQMLPYTKKT